MVQYTSTPVLSPVIGPPRPLLLLLVVAGQVADDLLPGLPAVAGAEEDVGRRGRPSSDRAGEIRIGAVHWKRYFIFGRVDARWVVLVDA